MSMRVLFATAELRPYVSAGGLGEAASGLAKALVTAGLDVVVALPDYERWELADEQQIALGVPEWAAPATARIGRHPELGRLALVDVPGIERPHPYVDAAGTDWPDNGRRFIGFSAAVAALADEVAADVVHLNDWHTSFAPAFLPDTTPTLFTIHNLAFQGWFGADWLHRLPARREAYHWGGGVLGMAGALRTADAIVAVSPTYAEEICTPEHGMGLHEELRRRADVLVGIRNGIDTTTWDPATDPHVPAYSADDLSGKEAARARLLDHVGWSDDGDPLVVMVTRLVDQKGVDLAFDAARFLDGMRLRLIVLGSGERRYADWGRWLADRRPDRFHFHDGYDAPLSHLLFAGGDLLLMPSRFEPCGLAQMQAMAYGTVPVVTAVGGLCDTVVDADAHRDGNGFVAAHVDQAGVVDALHRAARAVRHPGRRRAIQRRGMEVDWSWAEPAREFIAGYEQLTA